MFNPKVISCFFFFFAYSVTYFHPVSIPSDHSVKVRITFIENQAVVKLSFERDIPKSHG